MVDDAVYVPVPINMEDVNELLSLISPGNKF